MADSKVCKVCNQLLSLNEFNRAKHGKFGRNSRCRSCSKEMRSKIKECVTCKKNFKAVDQKAKYCSDSCRGRKTSRFTFEEVRSFFTEKGCTLTSTEYKNSKSVLEYICKCGREEKKTLGAFTRNAACAECIKILRNESSRKHSIEEVRKVFSDNDCVLLEETYINSKTKMKCICKCGEISYLRYDNVARGSHCRKCSFKKVSKKNQKYKLEDVRKIFEDSGCVLLSDRYRTVTDILSYRCSCGNESKIRLSSFQSGSRCMNCAAESRAGENNHQWKHDKTNEERLKGRKFREYTLWRRRVFVRDDYTCKSCGQYGGGLAAHHLDGWHWCKEKRLSVDNGITLCNTCHEDFHMEYGKRNNTKEQFESWFIKRGAI